MLSWIATDFFAQSPVLAYPVAALGIFMLVFAGVSLRTLLAPKDRIEALARLPLDEGSVGSERVASERVDAAQEESHG